jgi:uncharacterized membrane protein
MLTFTIPDILWFLLKILSFIGIVFVGVILFNYISQSREHDAKQMDDEEPKS